MSDARKPAAFRIEPESSPKRPAEARAKAEREVARKPRALQPDIAIVTPAEIDIFDQPDAISSIPPPPVAPKRRSRIGLVFFGAVGILISLATGLWADRLIRELFERSEWLGWLAAGMAAIAALAFAVMLVREILAISRLASVERLRSRALDAMARDDPKAARAVVGELSAFVSGKPETAGGRRALADLRDDIISGCDRAGNSQMRQNIARKAEEAQRSGAAAVKLRQPANQPGCFEKYVDDVDQCARADCSHQRNPLRCIKNHRFGARVQRRQSNDS